MTWDGDSAMGSAEAWKRVAQSFMSAMEIDLETALAQVPEEHRDDVRSLFEAEERQYRFHRPGATIRRGGPKDWFREWRPEQGYLWSRMREYLIDRKGWSLGDVDDLDASSDNVLSHLEDPLWEGAEANSFRVQGLVLGYVQAGKTANYTALIAKAVDRGYRLVIVLSGIHNSLRRQTQRRLELELGLVPDEAGVGLPEVGQGWWSITTSDLGGDFNPGTDAGPLQSGARGLMVVKKNATVLKRLVKWLQGRVPSDLPVLIIDDEADQASINLNPRLDDIDLVATDTGDYPDEKELDPSTINGLIRDLMGSFNRVSYVAYTATPFANVLIHPDAEGGAWGPDLFPRDFIISLDRPAAYVGAERIFGRAALEAEESDLVGLDIVEIVPFDELALLSAKSRGGETWQSLITPSLRQAFHDWLLATAAKVHRLGDGKSSMLIHTTPRIAEQNALGQAMREELRSFRSQWRYENESVRPVLEERWNSDFRPVTAGLDIELDVPFDEIEPSIDELLSDREAIQLLVLNSDSDDELDYESNPTLKVILIGGNRLSRGLTLEDLLVSFYVRDARAYDTLLQMGRWFGYRSKYADLTRLWTSEDLIANFRHLSLVEEDLRDQIKIYEREQLTPLDVAPKIRSHSSMMVTAKNRMGSAEKVRQSYAGELLQSVRFRLGSIDWLRNNEAHALTLLRALGQPNAYLPGDSRPIWVDVPWEEYVVAFLSEFRTAQDAMSFDADTAARYIRRQAEEYGELIRWTVAVRSARQIDQELGTWETGNDAVGPLGRIGRSRLVTDSGSIGALVSPSRRDALAVGDESIDLDSGQLLAAEEHLSDFPTVGHALRWARSPEQGLLLLYPISPKSKPGPNAKNRRDLFDDPTGKPTVVGVALSFPASKTGATVEYVAGRQSRNSIFATDVE